jgi:hypothetical protein
VRRFLVLGTLPRGTAIRFTRCATLRDRNLAAEWNFCGAQADFLELWPGLEQLQRAKPATIERFFIDHHSRDRERIALRLEQIRKAVPATLDATVLTL